MIVFSIHIWNDDFIKLQVIGFIVAEMANGVLMDLAVCAERK
jgi:hypothetical protein